MPSVAPPSNPPEGRATATVLGGRYSLQRRIALGGMGAVWAATDTVLGRQVAVKILREELVDSPAFLARFRAEARHTASLAHPGIASVFDYGEDQQGDRCVAYLVMELVPGTPLSQVMAARGTLRLDFALSLLAQTARALHAAHLMGIVHRDVKPGNLLVLDDGTIKVTDFGIARAASSVPLTDVGQVVGTARYMSPEQATGTEITPASDLYSLGVIAYEMLAGRPPFSPDNAAALAMAHVHQPPPPLPATVPAGVRAVIAEALAKDPADRPRDAQTFARRLEKLLAKTGAASNLGGGLVDVDGIDAPTRVMGYSDGPRTSIMPAHAIVVHDPRVDASASVRPPGRQRRWIAGVAFAAVLVVVALAQLGGVEGTNLDQQATPSTVPTTTPAASVTTIAPAPTTTVIVETSAPTSKGHGKGHKPKG